MLTTVGEDSALDSILECVMCNVQCACYNYDNVGDNVKSTYFAMCIYLRRNPSPRNELDIQTLILDSEKRNN